ncbi:23S ribosomal RNA methyltransferase Erm [Aeromicrobium sp. PE09-221]|uniref:23S ribosomal RNA methyltransferase Erm n=1 Tax=Aeromicrobium sp. PE09-221 TaxID=1898043 RepID=UPI000B3E9D98|nr:23S ribosomal RNA methyltransferase Erm [Aeromicrobium sp. PE09-221]OUZ12175.1 23S ribosomal RNA methyltransferase Erm [Aeromicrobium sp. PE09-221]
MRSPSGGRHELGQNFLHDRGTIGRILHLVDQTSGPVLEIGCGRGALTRPLAELGRPLLAIDIDPRCVQATKRSAPGAQVMHLDALRVRLDRPVVVGNLPFHLTTPILRRLLSSSGWTDAVLLLQWEVARKRAGVGGRTMLTAQTDPWFTVRLDRRVPAEAFRPRPSVDGGILTIRRRADPLLPADRRRDYERFVKTVFTARGRGLAAMLRSAGAPCPDRLLRELGVGPRDLPRDLSPEQWAGLFARRT